MYGKTLVRYIQHERVVRAYKDKWIVSPPAFLSFWELLECQWGEWVDRLARWWFIKRGLLKKVNEPLYEVATKIIEIDDKKIVEQVIGQVDEIYREFHTRPEYVLVGLEQFTRINHELRELIVFHLNGNLESYYRDYNGKTLIIPWNGIKVIIVPWMEGAIALPSLDKLY